MTQPLTLPLTQPLTVMSPAGGLNRSASAWTTSSFGSEERVSPEYVTSPRLRSPFLPWMLAGIVAGTVTTDPVLQDDLLTWESFERARSGLGSTTALSPFSRVQDPRAESSAPAAAPLTPVAVTSAADGLTAPDTPETQGSVEKLSRLRRLSGLTWDQLARLFDVDRRSMHYWASGRAMGARHEEQLGKLLAVISWADRGSAEQNRSALLSPTTENELILTLLQTKRYEEARAALGRGPGRRELPPVRLSPEAEQKRRPMSPESLVDALQDAIPVEGSRPRPVRVARMRVAAPETRTATAAASETAQGAGSTIASETVSETVSESRTETDT